tara:strand:- start:5809 stop:6060 length:252 start_codon:yes stop_codon:yes gene_type:complete
MTNTQRKWFERLEKTLSAMPKGVEIVVESYTYDSATIRLMPEGGMWGLEESSDHDRARAVSHVDKVQLGFFGADNVIANSENI